MNTEPIDRVLILLLASTFAFCAMLFAADMWFTSDQQLFTVLQGLATGFGGAVLARIKPAERSPSVPINPATATVTSTTTVRQEPEPKPEEPAR